jgi:hypothetical protein
MSIDAKALLQGGIRRAIPLAEPELAGKAGCPFMHPFSSETNSSLAPKVRV